MLQAHQFRLSWSSMIISIFSISTFVSAVVGNNVLAIMNSPYSEYPRQLLIYLQLLLGSNFSRFFVIPTCLTLQYVLDGILFHWLQCCGKAGDREIFCKKR